MYRSLSSAVGLLCSSNAPVSTAFGICKILPPFTFAGFTQKFPNRQNKSCVLICNQWLGNFNCCFVHKPNEEILTAI